MKRLVFLFCMMCFGLSHLIAATANDSVKEKVVAAIDSSGYAKAFEKLSPEQIVDVIKTIENNKKEIEESKNNSPFNASTDITSLAPFIMVIFILLIVFTFKFFKNKQRNALILKYVEKGLPVPESLLDNKEEEEKTKKSNLQIGLIMLSIGVGITVMFWVILGPKMSAIGLIPLCMGIGYLIFHFLEKKQKDTVE